jgi:hypothetical protein
MLASPPIEPPRTSVSPVHALLTAADRRVRAPDPHVQDLLFDGCRRSATFAALVTALNKTDVIVYIENVMTLPKDIAGRLLLLPHSGTNRYLRVQVRADAPLFEAIATIGHELRHALEIAEAPDVRDQRSLASLYERIGRNGVGAHSYDTEAAQITGRQIRIEVSKG